MAAPLHSHPPLRRHLAPTSALFSGLDWHEDRQRRAELCEDLLHSNAIHDPCVLDAFLRVPRHLFVPDAMREVAYADRPLPIGHDQTISQPWIVAVMTEALDLDGTERVLEIGTGSGYQAAVLSRLAREVFSMERNPHLAKTAGEQLARTGCSNVHVAIGNGYEGWPEHAPFDRIVLTAAPPDVPGTLFDQLAEGGRLVAPVGDYDQRLVRVTKTHGNLTSEDLGPVRFVPMLGRELVSEPAWG